MYQRHRASGTFGGYRWTQSGRNRSLCHQGLLLSIHWWCLSDSLQEIDLLTATKEDLTFTAPFNLVATRDDCELIVSGLIAAFTYATLDVHAFLAWFDIVFDCTHKKVKFSTGPHAQYTHWKYVCNSNFSSSGIYFFKTGRQCSIPPRQLLSQKGKKSLA